MPTQADAFLLEKQQAFDRSKIQERIVHPCGSSAFGYFQVTQDVSKWTKAEFLQFGKKTPAYTRFSTVTYGREFPDVGRNPRGFATKFYTGEGNFDLVGLSKSRSHTAHAGALYPSCGTQARDPVQREALSNSGLTARPSDWPVFFVRDPMQGPDNSE